MCYVWSDQVKLNSTQIVTLLILKPTNCGTILHFYGLFVGHFLEIPIHMFTKYSFISTLPIKSGRIAWLFQQFMTICLSLFDSTDDPHARASEECLFGWLWTTIVFSQKIIENCKEEAISHLRLPSFITAVIASNHWAW